jgi:hypothetical protein
LLRASGSPVATAAPALDRAFSQVETEEKDRRRKKVLKSFVERRPAISPFEVTDVDGRMVRYRDIWQYQNLVLVTLGSDCESASRYIAHLADHREELTAHDTALVIWSADGSGSARPPDVPVPSVLLADRFGEIYHVETAPAEADLPSAAALIEWLRYMQSQCPECDPK